jgi:hypothetical protein
MFGYRGMSVAGIASTMVLVAVTGFAAGCSSRVDGSSRAGARTEAGLLAALAMVRATDSTRAYFRYGDIGRTRALVEADRSRFQPVHGHGLGRIRNYTKLIADGLGFDPLALRESVQAGNSADWSAIFRGDYDVDAVNGRLADRRISRADRDGSTEWTVNADGEVDLDGPLAGVVPLNEFNNVRTQPGSFAFSPKREHLAWVTDPGQDTLALDPSIRAVAACLGDVVAATIATQGFDAPVAVGVRASGTTDVTEVICVAPGAADQATRIRDQVTALLANGTSPLTRAPWSQLVPNATVEVTAETLVRVVARLDAPAGPGRILGMVETTEIKDLVETG